MIDLSGKKGLVVGIANEDSIAYQCAREFRTQGADLAVTFRNQKDEPHVRPLAEALGASLCLPLDVRDDGQMDAVFHEITERWGTLDFLLHGIAYAPKDDLRKPFLECSREGFLTAMDISCHSLVRLAAQAAPLMKDGGCILTLTYYGAEKVIEQYRVMGPVKTALEGSVRYLAAELGPKFIRVHGLSPGPFRTRAASVLKGFEALLDEFAAQAPQHRLADKADVGAMAAFLVSDRAKTITGNIVYIDAGYHIMG